MTELKRKKSYIKRTALYTCIKNKFYIFIKLKAQVFLPAMYYNKLFIKMDILLKLVNYKWIYN